VQEKLIEAALSQLLL